MLTNLVGWPLIIILTVLAVVAAAVIAVVVVAGRLATRRPK